MESLEFNKLQISSIIESGQTANPFDEIGMLLAEISEEADVVLLQKVHNDIQELFSGRYPGFRVGSVKYHDLRHTYNVVLAATRLFHGLYHENISISPDYIFMGLVAAYFHDTGLLPKHSDTHHHTRYSRDHEERSITVLYDYLGKNGFPERYMEHCGVIIKYTNLDWVPPNDNGGANQLNLCGQVVGSADLLAQMADRYYLESLPLLFHEHEDGGINRHSSAIDLMSSTIAFHENIIKKRLSETLGNLAPAMKTHFRKRWGVDRNVYQENIDLNLIHLRKITRNCSMDLSCWGKYLRRNPPTADL